MKMLRINNYSEIPKNFTGIIESPSRIRYWLKDGKLSRLDGPACEYSNGHKEWCFEGKQYLRININDYVILDHYKGKHGIMWYKLLDEDEIIEYPDISGLIRK